MEKVMDLAKKIFNNKFSEETMQERLVESVEYTLDEVKSFSSYKGDDLSDEEKNDVLLAHIFDLSDINNSMLIIITTNYPNYRPVFSMIKLNDINQEDIKD